MRHLRVFFLVVLFSGSAALSSARAGEAVHSEDSLWTIVAIYEINSHASGLAWDGEYLYTGSYGGGLGGNVYRFDPEEGDIEHLFSGPQSNTYGLTWDGEFLWTIDRPDSNNEPCFALKLDMEGNAMDQFELPDNRMSGIAYDQGDFWAATYHPNPGTVYRLREMQDEWSVLASFTPPTSQPWGLARQDNSLWIAEYSQSQIHHVELDGTLISTYPGSLYRTSGVVHDGDYLWYVSRDSSGQGFLYKADPYGSGTPAITIDESHHFGNVIIGDDVVYEMDIHNPGEGDLIIEDLLLDEDTPFHSDVSFPMVVGPGSTQALDVTFSPAEIGEYISEATLLTNVPGDFEVQVSFSGNGLQQGVLLHAHHDELHFGQVRKGSSNRKMIHLQNLGSEQLEITEAQLDDMHFYITSDMTFPIQLSPVESFTMPLWFMPVTAGAIDEEIVLHYAGTNTETSSLHLDLSGISDDTNIPIGSLLWEYRADRSNDRSNHAKAILTIPDINEDGIPDVVVSSRDRHLRAFNSNASGTGDLLWELSTGTVEYPKSIALGSDINDDGFQDIVIGTAWSHTSVVAVSSATGEKLWKFDTDIYGNGGWVNMIDVTRDYTGNGYMDVLAAVGDDIDGTGPKRVFCLDGQTGDIVWETPLNAVAFSVMSVGDITGDGVPDVIAGATSPSNQGRVLALNGADGSIVWEKATAGTTIWALEQVGEISANGMPGIIAGNDQGRYYLLDVTDGEILHSGYIGSSIIIDFWKAGDLNNDGHTDIVPSYSSIPEAIAISGLNGQVLWSTEIADQPWSVTVLNDISGSGVNDVAVGTIYQNNELYFLEGVDGRILKSVGFASPVDAVGQLPDVTGNRQYEVLAGGRNGFIGAFASGDPSQEGDYSVTFEVQNTEGIALEAVAITIEDAGTYYTNQEGFAITYLDQGQYSFQAVKENYHPYDSTFEVQNEDIVVAVTMAPDETPVIDTQQPALEDVTAYPNPFRDKLNLSVSLRQDELVSMQIYDARGHLVYSTEMAMPAGESLINWHGRNNRGQMLQQGIFFIEITAGEGIFRDRVILLKN